MAACEVLLGALKKFGIKLKVGVVLGDSVLEHLDELQEVGVSLAHIAATCGFLGPGPYLLRMWQLV